MFYGVGVYWAANRNHRRQAWRASNRRGHQSASGGNDQPRSFAYCRTGDGGDAAGSGGERRIEGFDDTGGERRLFHGSADAVQGKP